MDEPPVGEEKLGPLPAGAAPGSHFREGTDIRRAPSLTPLGAAVPGEPLEISVDLLYEAQDPATEGPPLEIRGLPSDWSGSPIEVHLLCRDLEFEHGADRGILIVQRSRASEPCVLRGKVRADVSGDKIEVVATFSYLGRFLGAARRSISLSRAEAAPSQQDAVAQPRFAAQEIDLEALAPELTVFVSAIDGQESLWKLWVRPDVRLMCPSLPASLSDTVRTRLDWERFASRLRA